MNTIWLTTVPPPGAVPAAPPNGILFCLTCNQRVPDMHDFGNHQKLEHEVYFFPKSAAAVPAAQEAEGQQLCVCGHVADAHGSDETGHCGATRACRAGGCKQFKPASLPVAPSRQEAL